MVGSMNRPSETVAGAGLLVSVYGALEKIHVPDPWTWILAVVVAFVPYVVSEVVDSLRGPDDPGDHVPTGLPAVKKGKDEKVGLVHERSGL